MLRTITETLKDILEYVIGDFISSLYLHTRESIDRVNRIFPNTKERYANFSGMSIRWNRIREISCCLILDLGDLNRFIIDDNYY